MPSEVQPRVQPHGTAAADASARRKLWYAVILAAVFAGVQFVGGVLSGSLAVVADAAHMVVDLSGFLVALGSMLVASKAPTATFTYGLHRAEVLGSLFSIQVIWLMVGVLCYEAALRLADPQPINGLVMLVTAAVGIGFNVVLMVVLGGHHGHGHDHDHDHGPHGHGHHATDTGARASAHGAEGGARETEQASHDRDHSGHGHDHGHAHDDQELPPTESARPERSLAVRAAVLHAATDLLQSVGLLAAAALIYALQDRWLDENGLSYWLRLDPICTFAFGVLALSATVPTAKAVLLTLMGAVPAGVDADAIARAMREIDGVTDVHDLHVWALAPNKANLSVHLTTAAPPTASTAAAVEAFRDSVVARAKRVAHRAGVYHTTVEVEGPATRCDLGDAKSFCDGTHLRLDV